MTKKIPKRETLRKKDKDTPTRTEATPAAIGGRKTRPDPLDELPESARWDPVIESSVRQAPEVLPDDEENNDGRNETAQLVEDGVSAADDEQAEQGRRRDPDR